MLIGNDLAGDIVVPEPIMVSKRLECNQQKQMEYSMRDCVSPIISPL